MPYFEVSGAQGRSLGTARVGLRCCGGGGGGDFWLGFGGGGGGKRLRGRSMGLGHFEKDFRTYRLWAAAV